LRPEESRRLAAARKAGIEAAERVLARRVRRLRAAAGPMVSPGILLAEGDSWFSYPLTDVLDALEDLYRWDVVSVAHAGDRVEDMAYDDGQFSKLERALRKLRDDRKEPKAILLSGGGNDIAGDEFAMLLNHKRSGLSPLNAKVVAGLLEDRLTQAIVSLAFGITHLCEQLYQHPIPIVLHGYDRPVPDGRGFLGGWSFLPGPWLEPGFRRKGFADLGETTTLMAALIKSFNDQLAKIPGVKGLAHVRVVDLQGTLSNELKRDRYQKDWANELHPTDSGFEAVAARIHRVLTNVG
jgi:lysophospholipase L1-like esterase